MKRKKILVVEDNAPSRALAQDVLVHRGHDVVTACDFEEAKAHLVDARLGLVLTDVHLPGGGGEALLRKIREEHGLEGVRVVAVTALAMAEDRQRLLGLGFDGYISKPIDIRSFVQKVESFIS